MATSAEENRDPASQDADAAGEDDEGPVEDLSCLKRQRGRKASALTRACNAAEGSLSRHPGPTELEKRLEALNAALDSFMNSHDTYVARLEDTEEIEAAGQYASRVTARHADLIKKIEEAMKPAQEAAPSELVRSRVAGSRASRSSGASVASKEAEISAELKALKVRQLQDKQKRRKQAEQMEAERRKQAEQMEAARRKQQDLEEMKTAEEELEEARLNARLLRAAESELAWERRNDFQEDAEDVAELPQPTLRNAAQPAEERPSASLASERSAQPTGGRPSATATSAWNVQPTEERPSAAPAREQNLHQPVAVLRSGEVRARSSSGQSPDEWIRELRADHPREPQGHGPSAFTKSIPRLSLPTFRGSAREWPRWIGLFKALVHDH